MKRLREIEKAGGLKEEPYNYTTLKGLNMQGGE